MPAGSSSRAARVPGGRRGTAAGPRTAFYLRVTWTPSRWEVAVSTYDFYAKPVERRTWDVPAAGATRFNWDYDSGRGRLLLDLYQRGKDKQWDAAKRIDWELPVDPANVMEIPEDFCPIYGSRQWEMLSQDNVLFVLNHPDLATFNPLRFYVVRGGEVRRGLLPAGD